MYLIATGLLLFTQTLTGQTLFFNHLKGENGLSQVSVNSIYQDEKGIIWVGTRYGLNMYDGNKVEVFKHVKGDPNSIFSNSVQIVCGDKKGKLYLMCRRGLVIYDLITRRFNTVTENDVSTITYGNDNLWVCSNTVISKYDSESNSLIEYARLSIPEVRIFSVLESTTGQLYIGTRNHGLLVMDKNKRLMTAIPDVFVINLHEDSRQNICVSTQDHGFFIIERSGQTTNYRHNPSNSNSLPSDFVRTVCEDDFGNYWIGTFNGLCRFNPSQNKFSTFVHSESKPYSIGSSSIWCLYKDLQGTIWIGSYYGGVDYFNPEYSFFNFYGMDGGVSKSLSNPIVGKIREDDQNNVWIGTEGGGVNYINRKTGDITVYKTLPGSTSLTVSNIKALRFDEKNKQLWIGAHIEGLYKIDLKTNKSKVFRNETGDPGSLKNNYIRDIEIYNDKLYLASHNSVLVFDPQTEKCGFLFDNFTAGLENTQIWDMMLDHKNRLWFSTGFAFFRYDFNTSKLEKLSNQSVDSLNHNSTFNNVFFEDSKKRIWMGSAGGGLELYNEKSKTFTTYNTTNSAIIDDYIIDIKESKTGYLIIATSKGFTFFDVENNTFINFQNQSVFPISSINDGALYVARDGEIFIGSTGGLFSFQENFLNLQPKPFNIILTDMYVNNQKIQPSEKGILTKSITYTEMVVLKHSQNAISFEFSSSNYVESMQEDTEYMLSGFDKDWIKTNKRHIITYTNLNPGNYVLKIRSKQKGEVFAESSLAIRIRPPFYATWYSYLFYIAFVLTIVYIILRVYTSSIKLKVSLNYEKKEREQIEWLNQSKLRFFTNISHEFRTPLTLIISQIETLLQSTSLQSGLYNRLLSIHRNAHRMGKLINELLDFRKQEQGFMQLKASNQDLIQFLHEIILTFKEYSAQRTIRLDFNHKEPQLLMWFDTNQMEKVFYNLLSNAFKFTPDGGEICIDVVVENAYVKITVSDTGPGIDEKDKIRVFDRFYQAENGFSQNRNNPGTGIGLALARGIVELHHGKIETENNESKGSRFIVTLPINDDYLTAEQKVSVNNLAQREMILEVPDEQFINELKSTQQADPAQKSTILLVEDNLELLSFLVNLFSQIYHVETAVNGREGLEKATEKHPDIIVSDVMMPEMSGVEMCSKLKSNIETCHIPVILLTARAAIEYSIEGFRTGADDYLTKPFDTRLLIARCNNLINTRKQLQAKYSKQADAKIDLIATNSLDHKFMTRAIELVEKMIDDSNFDVNYFAQEMLMGRTAFFQKLKGITGQTPNEFITSIRLKKSITVLLDEPELSVSDVGYKLGFSSPSYFTKCFREQYGITPVKFRKDNLKVAEE
jgi:signal transduction histidine kinase/ligand-binding sensor domain-containing protein/DNA-binding response OmpR family regulator